jgi:hypothetical protein
VQGTVAEGTKTKDMHDCVIRERVSEEREREGREREEKEVLLCACAYIIYNQPWRAKIASREEREEREGLLCACAYIIYNQPWRAKIASWVDLLILDSSMHS